MVLENREVKKMRKQRQLKENANNNVLDITYDDTSYGTLTDSEYDDAVSEIVLAEGNYGRNTVKNFDEELFKVFESGDIRYADGVLNHIDEDLLQDTADRAGISLAEVTIDDVLDHLYEDEYEYLNLESIFQANGYVITRLPGYSQGDEWFVLTNRDLTIEEKMYFGDIIWGTGFYSVTVVDENTGDVIDALGGVYIAWQTDGTDDVALLLQDLPEVNKVYNNEDISLIKDALINNGLQIVNKPYDDGEAYFFVEEAKKTKRLLNKEDLEYSFKADLIDEVILNNLINKDTKEPYSWEELEVLSHEELVNLLVDSQKVYIKEDTEQINNGNTNLADQVLNHIKNLNYLNVEDHGGDVVVYLDKDYGDKLDGYMVNKILSADRGNALEAYYSLLDDVRDNSWSYLDSNYDMLIEDAVIALDLHITEDEKSILKDDLTERLYVELSDDYLDDKFSVFFNIDDYTLNNADAIHDDEFSLASLVWLAETQGLYTRGNN